MSAPASRSVPRVPSSSRPSPTSSTALPAREHTTTTLSRLKHMFDSPRYSIFEAHVRIEELANVPQLEGGFTARWKFRARKADKGLGNKPSLPNLRVHGPLSSSTLSSASSLSLRSAPITPITGTRPVASPENSLLEPQTRTKANTLPPHALSPLVPEDGHAALQVGEKKTSDPSPLREIATAGVRRTSSPEPMSPADIAHEPPELAGATEGSRRPSDESASSSRGSGSGSVGAFSAGSASATADSSRRGSLHPPGAPGLGLPHALTTAASSSSPSLAAKPFPQTGFSPARSGTSPSPAIILDHVPSRSAMKANSDVRPPTSRTVSQTTASTSSTGTGISSIRNRVVSGPGAFGVHKKHDDLGYATSRKGTTPVCQLKAHTVAWHYDLRYIMRVPLVKQATVGGVNAPSRKTAAPMLGQGPLSESGFRLVFEQMPEEPSDRTPSGMMSPDSPRDTPAKAHSQEKYEFGSVDIDLAPFAGKGSQTRRYLLKKSRTNAVVKLTVDVRLIGGETNFTTPPMVEGHHISGMLDMVHNAEAGERARHDVRLERTASQSSSSNSSLSHPSQASSAIDLSLPQAHSTVDLSRHAPHMAYKSFEHHLKPADALRPSPKRETSKLSQFSLRTASPGSTPRQSPSRQVSSGHTPQASQSTPHTPPASPSATRQPTESPQAESTPTPTPASPVSGGLHLFGGHHKHHRHHAHHLHAKRQDSVLGAASKREMLPEEIIEAVFNPRPSHERTPLTYKVEPKPATPTTDQEEGHASYVVIDPAAHTEDKPRPNAPGRWERMKQRTASHRHQRERERMERTQTSVSAA